MFHLSAIFVGSRILSIGDIPKDQLYPLKYPFNNFFYFAAVIVCMISALFSFDFVNHVLYYPLHLACWFGVGETLSSLPMIILINEVTAY